MEKQPHPLVNRKDSPHYDGDEPGEKTLIEQFEEKYSVRQLYDWAMITEDKYLGRLGKKDDIDKEHRKMKSYMDYKTMLKEIIMSYPTLADMTAKTAYGHLGYNWRY